MVNWKFNDFSFLILTWKLIFTEKHAHQRLKKTTILQNPRLKTQWPAVVVGPIGFRSSIDLTIFSEKYLYKSSGILHIAHVQTTYAFFKCTYICICTHRFIFNIVSVYIYCTFKTIKPTSVAFYLSFIYYFLNYSWDVFFLKSLFYFVNYLCWCFLNSRA